MHKIPCQCLEGESRRCVIDTGLETCGEDSWYLSFFGLFFWGTYGVWKFGEYPEIPVRDTEQQPSRGKIQKYLGRQLDARHGQRQGMNSLFVAIDRIVDGVSRLGLRCYTRIGKKNRHARQAHVRYMTINRDTYTWSHLDQVDAIAAQTLPTRFSMFLLMRFLSSFRCWFVSISISTSSVMPTLPGSPAVQEAN